MIKDKILKEFTLRKLQADANWDRVFSECLNGRIDREKIYIAITLCNSTELALIDYKYRTNNPKSYEV